MYLNLFGALLNLVSLLKFSKETVYESGSSSLSVRKQ